MDQHTDLGKKSTLREYLKKAFDHMIKQEAEMFELYNLMSEASEEQMNKYMERAGVDQVHLHNSGFYEIVAKIFQVSDVLVVSKIVCVKDVSELSGVQRTKILLA